MPKLFLAAAFFFLSFITNAQIKNPFTSLRFDKVVIYDYEGGKEGDGLIISNGRLAPSVSKQAVPDKATIMQLNARLGSRKSYGGGGAACFDPHLGIVYYLQNTVVAHISVCMDCNRLSSSIRIRSQEQGKTGTGAEVYYLADGMSKSFRQFLTDLLKKYSFSHQN